MSQANEAQIVPVTPLQPTDTTTSPPLESNQTSKDRTWEKGEISYLTGTKLYTLVLALLLTVLIMTLDMSVMSTAIPRITDDFHTIRDVGWYGAAYLTTTSCFQPLSGRIYSYFSLKWAYLSFIGIFAFGSLLCGVAVSSPMLIVGRSIAGIGGSGLINGAMTILGIEAPPEGRPTLMGMLFAAASFGQVIGPLIGGALTQHLSWRWSVIPLPDLV
jgi:MFS family permease